MGTRPSYMRGWVRILKHWKLSDLAAVLLEAAGPLTILLVQFFYMGRPFLRNILPAEEWDGLIHMLENREESREFISLLYDDKEEADWLS